MMRSAPTTSSLSIDPSTAGKARAPARLRAAAGCAALTLLAAAQVAEPQERADELALEEVVVSAEKYETGVQEIPIAITAVDPETIEKNRIRTAQDLTNIVPGVTLTAITGSTLPAIRGIGTNLGQSTVAVYVDGVSTDGVYNLLGLERVEVLKGPQGTYFGGNAVSGAVSFVTLTPKQEMEASATVTFGNLSTKEVSGYLSGGLTDNLAVGIYAAGSQRDTFIDHLQGRTCVTLVGYEVCEPEDEEQYGFRLKAVYEPTERLTLTGSFESQQLYAFEGVAFRQVQPNAVGFTAFGAPRVIEPYVVTSNWAQFSKTRKDLSILRADLDVTWAQLVSLTGYRKFWDRRGNDIDATSAALVGTVGGIEYQPNHTFSEELQLLSPAGSRWQWVAGLFYSDTPGNTQNTTPQAVAGGAAPVVATASDSDSTTYAGYAQVKWPVTDALDLTLGGRYTRVDRKLQTITHLKNLDGSQVRPPIFSPSLTSQNSDRYSQFTPKVAVDYKTGETLLYASYGKGFIPGSLGSGLGVSIVDPETLNAFEIGVKSDLTPRLRVNASTYYYDYKDTQLTVFVTTASGATGTQQVNAEGLESYGVEAEVTAAVASGLTLTGNVSYIHARYKEEPAFASFVPGPVGNIARAADITDLQAIRAPEWVLNAAVDYTRPLAIGGSWFVRASYQYNDGYPWDPAGLFHQDSYDWVTASLGCSSSDDRWRVSLWGNNLTDSYTEAAHLTTALGSFVTDGAPRTYGATVTWSFK